MALDPNSQITVGGVTATVVVDGFRKGISDGGPYRVVRYLVDWADSDTFLDALLGIGSYSASSAVFPFPHAYPGNSNLLCMSAEGELVGTPKPDEKLLAGTKCIVDATYRSTIQGGEAFDFGGTYPEQAIGGVAYPNTAFHTRGRVEAIPLPDKPLVSKGDGGATANVAVTSHRILHVMVQDLVLIRYRLPYLPDTALASYTEACVNSTVFLGRAVGTVLFQSYDTTPEPASDGSLTQTLTLNFSFRKYDWNAEPVMQDSGYLKWDRVWDGTAYNYPYIDLRPLLLIGLS